MSLERPIDKAVREVRKLLARHGVCDVLIHSTPIKPAAEQQAPAEAAE